MLGQRMGLLSLRIGLPFPQAALFPASEDLSEGFLFHFFHKDRPPHFPPEPADIPQAHRAQDLQDLGMPGGGEIDHPLPSPAGVNLFDSHRTGLVLVTVRTKSAFQSHEEGAIDGNRIGSADHRFGHVFGQGDPSPEDQAGPVPAAQFHQMKVNLPNGILEESGRRSLLLPPF